VGVKVGPFRSEAWQQIASRGGRGWVAKPGAALSLAECVARRALVVRSGHPCATPSDIVPARQDQLFRQDQCPTWSDARASVAGSPIGCDGAMQAAQRGGPPGFRHLCAVWTVVCVSESKEADDRLVTPRHFDCAQCTAALGAAPVTSLHHRVGGSEIPSILISQPFSSARKPATGIPLDDPRSSLVPMPAPARSRPAQ